MQADSLPAELPGNETVNRYVNMIVQEGRHKLLKILIPLLQYLVGLIFRGQPSVSPNQVPICTTSSEKFFLDQ